MNDLLHGSPAGGESATLRPLVWLAVAVAGFAISLRLNRAPSPVLPAPEERHAFVSTPTDPTDPAETLTRTADFDAVFARAFWRRPQPAAVIKNAERREWSDTEGLTRLDWFLEVQSGQALRVWLDTNPFYLRKSAPPKTGDPARRGTSPRVVPKGGRSLEVFVSASIYLNKFAYLPVKVFAFTLIRVHSNGAAS